MTDVATPSAVSRPGLLARLLRLLNRAKPELTADQAEILAKVKFPCC